VTVRDFILEVDRQWPVVVGALAALPALSFLVTKQIHLGPRRDRDQIERPLLNQLRGQSSVVEDLNPPGEVLGQAHQEHLLLRSIDDARMHLELPEGLVGLEPSLPTHEVVLDPSVLVLSAGYRDRALEPEARDAATTF
jgi:hypothetical protein